jgi:hypothetical protein
MQDGAQRRGVQDDPEGTGSGGKRPVRGRPYLSLLRTHCQKSRESAHLCHQQVQGTIPQCSISGTFLDGSADPYQWITDPDLALFFKCFQDFNKKYVVFSSVVEDNK